MGSYFFTRGPLPGISSIYNANMYHQNRSSIDTTNTYHQLVPSKHMNNRYHPWISSMHIMRPCCPPVIFMDIIHRYYPWILFIDTVLRYYALSSSMDMIHCIHGCNPWEALGVSWDPSRGVHGCPIGRISEPPGSHGVPRPR